MYFKSNGKLMITGEYLVLCGARALAMPVRYGQSLRIASEASDNTTVAWKSYVKGKKWLNVDFRGFELNVDTAGKPERQRQSIDFIRQVLRASRRLNPSFLSEKQHWNVISDIDFDIEWGLGSSSSLISNVAWWADINPFDLFYLVADGSGYDIACARSQEPILYKYSGKFNYPVFRAVDFTPSFSDHLVFIYSGNKQDTAISLKNFDPGAVAAAQAEEISEISEQMAATDSPDDFIHMMQRHESIITECLGKKPVQITHFPGFPGAVKSLGAWGGDFLLAASVLEKEEIINYFNNKGYDPIIPFDEMRINNKTV